MMKHFVVLTEYRVGDVELLGHHIVKARSLESAGRKARRYFQRFYPGKPQVWSENRFFFCDPGVAVSIEGITEVKTLDDVVRELMPIS